MYAALPKIGQTDKALQTCLLLVESSSATNNIVGFEACLRTRFEASFQTRFEAGCTNRLLTAGAASPLSLSI